MSSTVSSCPPGGGRGGLKPFDQPWRRASVGDSWESAGGCVLSQLAIQLAIAAVGLHAAAAA
eukprot:15243758-Alexandrium_andersonii.AAC.1